MKAGAKATREAVHSACNSLMMAGTIPTVRDILQITGGSLSTITPLRDEWWLGIAAQFRNGQMVKGVPPDVSELLMNVWRASTDHAQRALDKERDEVRRAAQEAQQAVTAAREQVDSAIRQAMVAREDAAAALAAKAHSDHLLAQRAAEHQGVVSTLTAQIDTLGAQLRAAIDGHAADASRWDEDRKRLLLQVDSQKQEIARAQTAVSKLEPQLADARARASSDAARREQLERDLAAAIEALERSRAAELVATTQATAAEAQRDALATELKVKDSVLQSQREALLANADATKTFATELQVFKSRLAASPKRRRNSGASERKS